MTITLDLNNLFQPALAEGLESPSQFHEAFTEAQSAVMALKQTGLLPYAKLPKDSVMLDEILAKSGHYKTLENVVVFGIGGSALGASSLYHALYGQYQPSHPRLFVIDNIEPKTTADIFAAVRGKYTLFVFISKSGNTTETLAQLLATQKTFGKLTAKNTFVITDAQKGFLRDFATKNKLPSLAVPSGVGGRFSVFSPAGLFPLAVCGADIKSVLDGAAHMEERCQSSVFEQNPAGLLALTLHAWIDEKKITQVVMMPYAERLRLFADWFAQIWAESLGKKQHSDGKVYASGTTPIKALGVTDQHAQLQLYLEGPRDKLVIFVAVDDWGDRDQLLGQTLRDERVDFLSGKTLNDVLLAERLATEEALRESGCPNFCLRLPILNAFQLGQLYQLWMSVIPYLGVLLKLNAFDQPSVERIKKITYGLLGRHGFEDMATLLHEKRREFIF